MLKHLWRNKYYLLNTFILGWMYILEGMVMVGSLGHKDPRLVMRYMNTKTFNRIRDKADAEAGLSSYL